MFENKVDFSSKRRESNNQRGLPHTDHFTALSNTVKRSYFGCNTVHLEDVKELQKNVLYLSSLITSMCAPRLTPGKTA